MLLKLNVPEIAGRLHQYAARVPAAANKALDRVLEVVEKSAERYIGKIYARKIPKSRTGRAKWQRSGALADGLRKSRPSNTVAALVIEGRAAKYARYRHDLNRPGKDGITRFNPFFDQAKATTEPQLQPIFEVEFENELTK